VHRRRLLIAAALVLGACALTRHREVSGVWRLVPAESSLHFIGIKNDAVAVPGSFTTLEGSYDVAKRSGVVEVKLGTADTGNPARDENIRSVFFQAVQFPVARFEAEGLPVAESLPEPGASARVELAGNLSLHGGTHPLKVVARVSRDIHGHLHVRNEAPLVLSAHELGMDAQLAALKAVCGHESLSGAIPVEFDVAFEMVPAD
jgi:polyisoprenoid-binding protein YceI